MGILAVTAVSAIENVWHWRPQTKTGDYYRVTTSDNWTNETESITGTPPRGARVVIDAAGVSTANNPHDPWGDVTWKSGAASQYYLCVTSGAPIKIMASGLFHTSGLYLYGDGETFIDSAVSEIKFQKAFKAKEGSPTFVKKGSFKLICFCEGGDREYTFPLTKLQEGTLNISTYRVNENIEIRFDGPFQSRFEIGVKNAKGNTNLTFKSSALTESADAINSDHGVTSDYDRQLCFTGIPKVNPMVFTGKFLGSAGLQWKPDSADYAFVFSNAVSTTTGRFYVSNGTVRVTSGAGFSYLPSLVVAGANSRFEVDATALKRMPSTTIAISDGGKVKPASGIHLNVAAVTVNGLAVPDGLYCGTATGLATQANWIDGDGFVCVGLGMPEAAQVDVTWSGSGSDTLSSTEANWNDAAPTLTDGGAYVTASGGTGFTAADDVWLKGFDLTSRPAFAFGATAGKAFWLGSKGIAGGTGTYTINTPQILTTNQKWNFKSGATVNFNEPFDALGLSELYVTGTTAVYNVNSSLGPKGFQVHFEHKSTVNIAAGVTNNADIRIWNDQTDPNASDYFWSNKTYKKPVVFKGGAPTVMNGFLHNTSTEYTVTFEPNANVTFNAGFMGRNTTTLNVGAGARVRFNKPFLNRNGFYAYFDATGVFEMNAEANCFGYANPWSSVFNKGTIKLLVPYAIKDVKLPDGTFEYKGAPKNDAEIGRFEIAGSAVLDFCGNDQSLKSLAARGGTITSETDAVLTLNANHNWTAALGPTSRVDKTTWTGGVGLVYNGKDANWPRFMMNVSSTTGRLEVVQGRLVFPKASGDPLLLTYGSEAVGYYPRPGKDASWTNCCAVTVRGGTLELEHSKTFGPQTVVKFVKTSNAYGKIKLADGVKQRVYALEIDGEKQHVGTYGATGSGAQYVNDTLFAAGGTGVLSVVGDSSGIMLIFR